MTEMELATIFEIEDELAHDSAAAIRSYRRIEAERAMAAIRAGEDSGNRTRKLFRAFLTKRRFNSWCFRLAVGAKIISGLDIARANHAKRRIKKRDQCSKRFNLREGPHVLTRRVKAPK